MEILDSRLDATKYTTRTPSQPTDSLLPVLSILIVVLLLCPPWGDGHRAYSQQHPNPGTIRFAEHLIADEYTYAFGIAAVDLDRDGDLDLTSADARPNNSLYWFENDGVGNFKRHFIQRNDPERLERHAVGDLDRDGHPDVVIVKNLRGHLLWFRNSGTPTDGKLWGRQVITSQLPGAYDVALADLDADGDLDVVASSWRLGNQFAWFENDLQAGGGEWKKYLIEANIAETRTIRAADFDADGDIDLLGTASRADQTVWYENAGRPTSSGWKKHIVDQRSPHPIHGEPADMDGDGDMDVVMALGMQADHDEKNTHQVAWYENNGRPGGGPWKKHVIASLFTDGFEAVAADLDADGDLDVVATCERISGRIAWFENHGDPKGRWTMHSLKDNWPRANQVIIEDLNGDGRPDIAAVAERGSLEFRWWRNEGPAKR